MFASSRFLVKCIVKQSVVKNVRTSAFILPISTIFQNNSRLGVNTIAIRTYLTSNIRLSDSNDSNAAEIPETPATGDIRYQVLGWYKYRIDQHTYFLWQTYLQVKW